MNLTGVLPADLTENSANPPTPAGSEWFCVHAQPKKVFMAAQSLYQLPGVDCYLPLLKFQRVQRKKKVWVTEPLFPGYLFARFHFQTSLRAVYYAQGVSRVIHFGDHWPVIPGEIIEQLQQSVGETGVKTVEDLLVPGDEVQINTGPFKNLSGLVSHVYPGKMRIAVLMDFLGRQTTVEIPLTDVRSQRNVRHQALTPTP
jgi:transcriptional antiterminator RfaH